MAFDPAHAHAAFRALSICHTVQHLFSEVNKHLYGTFLNRPGCFNPLHFTVTEITVIKRSFFVQHEGLLIELRYQPVQLPQPAQPAQPGLLPQPAQPAQPTQPVQPGLLAHPAQPLQPPQAAQLHSQPVQPARPAQLEVTHPARPLQLHAHPVQPAHPADFYLLINRNINLGSSSKLATDRVECTAMQTQPSGLNHVTVWHLPLGNGNNFQLDLVQLAIILNHVSCEAPRYNLLAENRFWFTHATRQVVARVLEIEDSDAFIVEHHWLWRIGTCFHWRVDNVGQGQLDNIIDRYTNTLNEVCYCSIDGI